MDDKNSEIDNPQQQFDNNGDDLWILFSTFLEKIFLFCNQDQDLLNTFSSINHHLIEECFNNSILIKSIEQFTSTIFKELNSHKKDDQEAERLRKDGNDLFKDKMYADALESYSAAILKAKQIDDNDELDERNECCLAFANRSAAFFNLKNFKYALDDAQMALKLNHYDKDKLSNRIQKCKLALQHMDEQMSGKKLDETIIEPFTNDKMKLDFDDEKGRKLIANKSIEMGECLIKETAFASIVNSDYYLAFCNHCLRLLNGYGLPCTKCDYAIYCSTVCLNDATYHKEECGKIADLVNQLGVGYLVLRLAFKVGLESMINFSENSQSNDSLSFNSYNSHKSLNLNNDSKKFTSSYSDVYNLMTHENEFDLKENLSFTLVSLFFRQVLENYSRYTFTSYKWIKVCKLFLRHFQQLSTNLISIDQEVALDVYDDCGVQINEKLKVGIAFYPITSLLNHSCIPNVIPKFEGNQLTITAVKLIDQNSEILFCYGPSFYEDTKADRQKMLKSQYFFDCKCSACSSGEENKQRAFLCNQCNGPVILNKDKSNFCLNCPLTNQLVNKKQFDESLMLIRIAKEKFALKKFEDTIEDANEAYVKLVDTVHRHNKELRTCLDLLANSYSELGHYSVASKYLKITFKLVQEIFGLKSVESLVIFMKICNLDFLNLEEITKEQLKSFIDQHLLQFEELESEVASKVDKFKGFDELKFVKDIRTKLN